MATVRKMRNITDVLTTNSMVIYPNDEAKLALGKPLSPQIVAPVQGSGTGVFGSGDFRQQ
jgi:hypothetical protein